MSSRDSRKIDHQPTLGQLIGSFPTARDLIGAALRTASTRVNNVSRPEPTKDHRPSPTTTRRTPTVGTPKSGARSGDQRSRHGNGKSMTDRHTQGRTNRTAPWEIPTSQRQVICFDEIEIAEAFDCIGKLTVDFLPAGMAFVNYLANFQPYRSLGKAQDIRTLLLMRLPTRASLTSASHTAEGMRGAKIREDFLSARLTLLGQRYMLMLTGEGSVRQTSDEIVNELMKIAGEFNGLNHPRREAYARIIAADVFNVFLRNPIRAKDEMVRAIALLGVVFQADEAVNMSVMMTKLAISGDKALTDRTVADLGLEVGHDYNLSASGSQSGAGYLG